MSSAFRATKLAQGSAITYMQSFDYASMVNRVATIQHNLNTGFPIVNIYRPDGKLYKGYMEVVAINNNTITIDDNNSYEVYEGETNIWHVSVMSSGLSNTPISIPPLSIDTQIFSFSGVVKPTVGLSRWYPYINSTVAQFYASIEVTPSTTITLQLNKNGVALGSPVTILAGQYKSNVATINTGILPSDYLTVTIVSGSSGANIFATAIIQSTPQSSGDNILTPMATTTALGLVKVGAGLVVDTFGRLSLASTENTAISPVFSDNYDFQVFKVGLPAMGEVLGMCVTSKAYLVQATGYARALVAPTTTSVFSFAVNGEVKGTITFEAGANVGVATVETITIQAGDLLQVIAPIPADATLADVAITIGGAGTLALSLPAATNTTLGLVKVGAGIFITPNGSISTI